MSTATERYVAVPATALDDLLQLASRVAEASGRLSEHDPLTTALRGAIGEVRAHSVLEP